MTGKRWTMLATSIAAGPNAIHSQSIRISSGRSGASGPAAPLGPRRPMLRSSRSLWSRDGSLSRFELALNGGYSAGPHRLRR